METNLENYMPLSEISKFLVSTSNDPVTKWADDTAKIEFLTRILDSLRRDTKQQSYAIERITELLEVLQWKRCDLGRLLLHSGMVEGGNGQHTSADRTVIIASAGYATGTPAEKSC
ncbi:MAG: hypothetical protein HPY61_10280 [Methanotrichaceae archaeon]|nr:hypothetical protein [Methanotrichaceae archaeon]